MFSFFNPFHSFYVEGKLSRIGFIRASVDCLFTLTIYFWFILSFGLPFLIPNIISLDGFKIYSSSNLDPVELQKSIRETQELLSHSTIGDYPGKNHKIFFLSSPYLYRFLSLDFKSKASLASNGIHIYYFSRGQNLTTLPENFSGVIAHEVTHSHQRHTFGELGYYFGEKWASEGYAEYIRSNPTLSCKEGLAAILQKNQTKLSGQELYFLWGLMVKYALEKQNYSVLDIHTQKKLSIHIKVAVYNAINTEGEDLCLSPQ